MSLKTTEAARGKQGYRAPELLRGDKAQYNKKVDIWSLGCILFEISTGQKAFDTDFCVFEFIFSKIKRDLPFSTWFDEITRTIVSSWVNEMLEIEFQKRPSVDQLCQRLAELVAVLTPPVNDPTTSRITTDPTALLHSENMLGTDMPSGMSSIHWSDIFAPGNFEQHERSLQRYKRLLATRRVLLGNEHPYTVWSMICFAYANQFLSNDHEATVKVFEEISLIQKSLLGEEHPVTLGTIGDLVWARSFLGDTRENLLVGQKALSALQIMPGPEHPMTLKFTRILASLTLAMRKETTYSSERASAVKILEDNVKAGRRVVGTEHPETLMSMAKLAWGYHKLGRTKDALELYDEVFAAQTRVFGLQHIDTLWCMGVRAYAYSDLGRTEIAIQQLEQCVELHKRLLGSEHSETLEFAEKLVSEKSRLGIQKLLY